MTNFTDAGHGITSNYRNIREYDVLTIECAIKNIDNPNDRIRGVKDSGDKFWSRFLTRVSNKKHQGKGLYCCFQVFVGTNPLDVRLFFSPGGTHILQVQGSDTEIKTTGTMESVIEEVKNLHRCAMYEMDEPGLDDVELVIDEGTAAFFAAMEA